MKLKFEVTSVNKNRGGPNNPNTYNYVLQVMENEPMNREHFTGVPSGQINIGGAVELLAGMEETVVLDLTPVTQAQAPGPKPVNVQPVAPQPAAVVGQK